MNQNLCASISLLFPFAFHERLIADIAIEPSEIVPAEAQPDSQSQSWTTIAGTGLLLCAGIAVLIVRVKNARHRASKSNTGASEKSGASGQ